MFGVRHRSERVVFALVAGFILATTGTSIAADAPTKPAQYTGPGSCSSTSCHGGVQPRTETTVLQNEYSTWAVQDKHPKAYLALMNDVGKRMGRILNITPEKDKRCLVCHRHAPACGMKT